MKKVLLSISMSAILTFSGAAVVPIQAIAAQSPAATMSLLSQEPITAGATLKKYVWNNGVRSVTVNVVEVDLTNPYVKLDVMTGTNGKLTQRQTTSGMAKETGAVAGINGDFFNTQAEGVPDGPEIDNGQLVATPPLNMQGLYSFALDKNNKPIVDAFTFRGSITAKDGSTFPLGGINKTSYWLDDANSTYGRLDQMYMYTDEWAVPNRTYDGATVPSEILVQNGIILKIAIDSIIPGSVPAGAVILQTNGKATDYVKQHLKVGDLIKMDYQIVPMDASKNYDTKSFKMMIGGETLLVDQGKPSIFTRDINDFSGYARVSRTAIGYSQDMTRAYLITADLNSTSAGMTIPELQDAMVKAGVWRGMCLDGGGSTSMVTRPLGDTNVQLVQELQNGVERKVVNGVGVYSTAPKSNVVKGLFASGPAQVFIGEKAVYGVKAYDEYYNPMDAGTVATLWSSSSPIGAFQGNVFTAAKAGTTTVSVASGQGTAKMDVQVVGRNDLAGLTIRGSNLILSEGETFHLPVIATMKNGAVREIPPDLVSWELLGFQGSVSGGQLTVTSLQGSQLAQIIARYEGYSTMLTLPISKETNWYDLDHTSVMTTTDKAPADTDVHVSIVQDPASGNKSLQLSYDFTKGTGTKAAYAMFDQASGGDTIYGRPEYMKLKVNGDNSLNWLRALVTDAAGKSFYMDLANPINWTGWKMVNLDFSQQGVTYPITLKGIYVVSPQQGQDERAVKGSIQLDDITFVYPGEMPALARNQVKLVIGNKNVSYNNQSMTLEQAPVIISGNTMIPIRFVTEALGGTVRWDDSERKVTIIRGDKLIDLWVGNPDLIVNGQRKTAEVAPVIMNNLTMVPLRIIAENMGWKVGWEPQGQIVTLQ